MRAAMEDPEHVVERVKRHMGNADFKRMFDGREITPEFLSALILKKLAQGRRKRGSARSATPSSRCRITSTTRGARPREDAGRIAGLNVIDIINEPTAATLTYAWKRGELAHAATRTATTHWRWSTTSAAARSTSRVVNYTPNHFQVLATDGDVHLGGVDWNDRLVDYVATSSKLSITA